MSFIFPHTLRNVLFISEPMLSIKCCVDEHIKATYKGEIANPPDIVGLSPTARKASNDPVSSFA